MTVHLINPSHVSFGVGVITPRWLYVLASATPVTYGAPVLTDETLEALDTTIIQAGDVVGIGIHTGNALRGYEIGTAAHAAGAYVVFGGIHATLYPDEARDLGGAHAVVTGDGERVWPLVLRDCAAGTPSAIYDGGRIEADEFMPGRWELLPRGALHGRRYRRCADVRSTVPSVPSGVPTASVRGSGTWTVCSTKLWSCAAVASGLSRSPMTTSTR
jgi:radical SAM superfamily enzyme YgiQ (UPF0313 family)